MSALASVLPFLAALKKQTPDFSGMTADPDPVDMSGNVNAPSRTAINPSFYSEPMGPPAPAAQQDPQPDMSIGAGQQPPADLSAAPTGKEAQPKLSKGTQLLMLLRSGLQGGLAGYAQNAQTYAQTGRNAGFGGGFAGATQLPFMQAYQRGQLAQQGAQTELLKEQAQQIDVPGYGSMPAGLAKVLFPSLIRAGATEQAATTRAGGTTQAATIGANARIQAAQMGLGPIADVPQDLQDQFGLPAKLPLKMLNTAESAANKPLTTVQGAGGPAVVNKQTKQTTNLGLGAPALARPVMVADPNNPGNITYQSAGQAERQGAMAPQSAPAVTAKATARELAPGGAVGKQTQAFNTAIQHANLLQQAVTGLNNGDVQGLNALKNSFNNYFGGSGPVTAQAIADAYTREVTKMLSAGHLTDSEIGTIGKTLDPQRQSPQQMLGVLQAYKALASSKLNVLQTGVQAGLAGRADFSGIQQHVIQIGNQKYQYKGQGATDDLRNYSPVQQ